MESNLERTFQAVRVISAVTRITQQHLLGVAKATADAAAGSQHGARPGDR